MIPIIVLNSRSVKSDSKKLDLEYLIHSQSSLPIVCITETWLRPNDPNTYLPLSKLFVVHRVDRASGRGGGVAILIPKGLNSYVISRHSLLPNDFEAIWVRLVFVKKSIDISVVYRPPQASVQSTESLLTFLGSNFSPTTPCVIVGDFNFPNINWSNLSSKSTLKGEDKLLEFVIYNGISQLVNFPTRGDSVCLDLIFVNEPSLIQSVNLGPRISNCDHETILANLAGQKIKKKTVYYRNYKKADYTDINNLLSTVNWSRFFEGLDEVQIMWNKFLTLLSTLIDTFIPLKSFSSNGNHFIPKRIQRLFLKQYKLYRIYKKSKDPLTYQRYLVAARIARQNKRQYDFEKDFRILSSKNSEKFWKHIKSKITYKSDIPCIRSTKDGTILVDSKEKADEFNHFFQSVFIEDNNIPTNSYIQHPGTFLSFIDFPPEVVFHQLEKLPNKSSSGPDNIPALLLKKLSVVLAEPLSIIFKKSFVTSTLPNLWLTANITPIFKANDSSNSSNYRPVSLTSVPCKVFESIIVKALTNHTNPCIYSGQHGFLMGRSTETQLLETLNDWTSALDAGKVIDILYLDISKAFDSVSHTKLISKLFQYGVTGLALDWIKAFLSNRKQTVVIDGVCSDPCSVTSGVPQGSVLGPILFLLYINDMPAILKTSKVKIFADDAKVYLCYRREDTLQSSRLLQEDITNLYIWCDSNQLTIALNKCAMVHLGYKNPIVPYFIGNDQLPVVDSIRDLGITISSNLKFGEHISKMCSKASVTANMIYRTFKQHSTDFLIQMFNTFVRSKLEYASTVWNPHLLKDIDLIEKVQRKFSKRLPGCHDLSYPARLKLLGIEPLELRRLYTDLTMVFKILNGLVSLKQPDFFAPKDPYTRGHSKSLYRQTSHKDVRRYFFSNRVVPVWNSLPEDLINSPDLLTFKNKLHQTDLTHMLKGRGLEVE